MSYFKYVWAANKTIIVPFAEITKIEMESQASEFLVHRTDGKNNLVRFNDIQQTKFQLQRYLDWLERRDNGNSIIL